VSDGLETQPWPELPGERSKPWYRRWWAITIGGLLTLFVAGGLFGDDTGFAPTDAPTIEGSSESESTEATTTSAPPPIRTATAAPPKVTATAAPPSRTTTAAPSPPDEPECHPSYTPCVEIASDVDCEGGSGDGPGYTGRVLIIGPDEYDLDRNGDGIGCEQS
jgi:hypothetical protein